MGGHKLQVIGWDRRYDQYENREARLVYKYGRMMLMITKRVHYKILAENLMKKYSFEKYRAWTRRGVLERIGTSTEGLETLLWTDQKRQSWRSLN